MSDSVSQGDGLIWDGFTMPDSDFFKMPNDFIKILPFVGEAELKVIIYVMRHTWGFQEYDTHKKITLDEFAHGRKLRNRERMDSGAGLGVTSTKTGIVKAIEHGFLECEIDDSDLGRIKKSYRLRMKDVNDEIEGETRQPAPEGSRERLKQLQTMPYAEYLQTPEWAKKRGKALRFAGYKCQLCNSKENLNVHHRTYERRGHELMGDLTVLCNDCHTTFTYNRELTE